MKPSKRTFEAFIARGIDSETAEKLRAMNYTIQKLKSLNEDAIADLGISKTIAREIAAESRPPIPIDVVSKLLHESRRTCCVCRNPNKPIVIHHLKEWHLSKDHSENNLVVLCIEHHDQAHTNKKLSLSLTRVQLENHKKMWLQQVKKNDAAAVLGIMQVEGSRWDYINIQRLFEIARLLKIVPKNSMYFENVKELGMVNTHGLLKESDKWLVKFKPKFWLYDCGDGSTLYFYISDILEKVLNKLMITDITEQWKSSSLRTVIQPNMFISLRGAFYFKALASTDTGRNQRRLGYRQKSKIRLLFEFDAWETTSSSSKNCHLRGHASSLCIALVKSITKEKDWLIINSSCLCLGSGFSVGDTAFYWAGEAMGFDEIDQFEDI